jgi:hypothetical protein
LTSAGTALTSFDQPYSKSRNLDVEWVLNGFASAVPIKDAAATALKAIPRFIARRLIAVACG